MDGADFSIHRLFNQGRLTGYQGITSGAPTGLSGSTSSFNSSVVRGTPSSFTNSFLPSTSSSLNSSIFLTIPLSPTGSGSPMTELNSWAWLLSSADVGAGKGCFFIASQIRLVRLIYPTAHLRLLFGIRTVHNQVRKYRTKSLERPTVRGIYLKSIHLK